MFSCQSGLIWFNMDMEHLPWDVDNWLFPGALSVPRALVGNHCYLMSHLIGSIFNDDDLLYFDPQINA